MKIAILGFGTIGSGVYEIIENMPSASLKNSKVVKVLDLPQNKDKLDIITSDIKDISQDDSIDCVVETLGGLHPAYEFIMECLKNKKHVVTANKAVVAAYLEEFLNTAKENGVKFLFEASTGGGIPWLASLLKAQRIDDINSFHGIFNGTSNFILDHMYTENKDFNDALKLAQELGYAEANPSADIDGYDVQNKVVISSALAFHSAINMNDFPCYSMAKVTLDDIYYLKNKGYVIKYIGEATLMGNEYEAFVMPNLFNINAMEANVKLNFNLVSLNGQTIGDLKFFGQGAGKLPTANAIVQDILDIEQDALPLDIHVDREIKYTDTLLSNNYFLRTNKEIINDKIERFEKFNDLYYIYTKKLSTKEFKELANIVLEKDENALIAKIANFD